MTQDQSPLPEPSQDETPNLPADKELPIEPASTAAINASAAEDLSPEVPPASPLVADTPPVADPIQQTAPVSPIQSPPQSLTLKELWREAQPVLKAQSIKVLRSTIRGLERVVESLEAEPKPKAETPSIPKNRTGKPVPAAAINPVFEKFHAGWQRFQTWWATVLPQIRTRLPNSINRRFADDRALLGAIAGILVLTLWISTALLPGQPDSPPVAIAPSPKQTPETPETPEQAIPPQLTAPDNPDPVAIVPAPSPSSSPLPPTPSPPPPLLPPSPSPVPSPSLPPPPALRLTPEQKLIAAIQDQVAEVSNQYLSGLIQSVQANFRSSRLTVNVGDGWYRLSQAQQNKLANELLRRTQELDFVKLELADVEGTLLARSPVVGSEMVILKRTNDLAPTG